MPEEFDKTSSCKRRDYKVGIYRVDIDIALFGGKRW